VQKLHLGRGKEGGRMMESKHKTSIVLHPDEYRALDEFHQAAATVLQRKGKIRIVEAEKVAP
jgi:hypothetical protein